MGNRDRWGEVIDDDPGPDDEPGPADEHPGCPAERLDRAATRANQLLAARQLDRTSVVTALMFAAIREGITEDEAIRIAANRLRTTGIRR
jgi:hypothetical protein